ncbi:MAG: RNA replicase beta chain [Guiyang fiers-like virus 2]|nr:MAG: RNA replicase beta chain [Guiyang fiers-like virus 2]
MGCAAASTPTEKYPVSKKRLRPRTANLPLPRSLTDDFVADLRRVLKQDPAPEALYLDQQFLTKFVELDKESAGLRQSRAIEKWLKTEATNHVTNLRISRYSASDGVDVLPGVSARRFFGKVRNVVAQIVPFTPSLDIANGGFSGGASTSTKRAQGHPALKFLDKADVTRPALPVFRDINRGTRWADHFGETGLEPRFVRGNVLFTVPKNANIDRVAAKEPDLNMFLQKGLGNQIRSCLRRSGIDLNDQSHNQDLARLGAITGSLATLDLSSASDSVTLELVRAVMPPDWFYYLDTFRSVETLVEGSWHVNEMFSSMGNGFTFELESLLFFAIARTVAYFAGVRGKISVYGDDIIVPTEMVIDLISALSFCGFSTNEEKSFWEGPFRESCGAHWHGDVDVTPFYLRRPFTSISDLILTLNQLTSWSSRVLNVVDPRYEEIIEKYAQYIPESLWGGFDLTSRYALVTGHQPRKKLEEVIEKIDHTHVGGLLFWMFLALPRALPAKDWDDALSGSNGSKNLAFMRIRKNRETVNRNDIPIFLNKR